MEGDKGHFVGRQHVGTEKVFDERHKHQLHDYLETVVEQTRFADELYIFGPAQTKLELSKLLHEKESRGPKRLQAVETADKMTLNEMVSKVKKFYLH